MSRRRSSHRSVEGHRDAHRHQQHHAWLPAAQLAAMVAQVREVAPEVPIGVFAMVAVGDRDEVGALHRQLGDNLYGGFVGERAKVLDSLRSLEALGIQRVQVSEFVKGSILRLAPSGFPAGD